MAQDAEAIRTAETLRDRALEGTIAYDVVEQITTRFGPRLAGTESERAAAAWGEGYMRELGLQNVRVHEFPLAVWNRGVERVEVLSPFPQPLTVTALGGAMATSEEGVTGEAVIFRTYQDMLDQPEGALDGKIAVVLQDTPRVHPGPGGCPAAPRRSCRPARLRAGPACPDTSGRSRPRQ